MDQAKEGFEVEWKQAQAECELLQEMMTELDAQEQKKAAQEVPVLEQLSEGTKGFYIQSGIPSDIPYKPWGEDVLAKQFQTYGSAASIKTRLLDMIDGEPSEELVAYCRKNKMYTAELLTGRPLPEDFPIQR